MSGTAPSERSGRPKLGESVLTRAFRLLGSFDRPDEALGLAELARRAGLPKSSTHRLAAQLGDAGALERLPTGEYVVGLRLLEVAALAPRGHGLRHVALPHLEDLHRVTRQHVLLAVRDGSQAVLVERLSTRDAMPVRFRVGGRLPLDGTGVGLALLAHAPPDIQHSVIEGPDCTDPSAAARRRVRQLLATVRSEGVVAVSTPNPVLRGPDQVSTVAAPVLDRHGAAVGAISIVSPTNEPLIGERLALRTTALAVGRIWAASRRASAESAHRDLVEQPAGEQ